MAKVATSRISYEKEDALNITIKSGDGLGEVLAPTWAMVAGHKLHDALTAQNETEIARWSFDKVSNEPTVPLDDKQYTAQYTDLLRQRYKKDEQPFLDILNKEKVTLTCYCAAGPGEFCHRHIAVDVLNKIADSKNIPFERVGELDPKTGEPWIDKTDPEYSALKLGIAPIYTPKSQEHIGYATGVLRMDGQEQTPSLMELAHFGKDEQAAAKEQIRQLGSELRMGDYKMAGMEGDLQRTIGFLQRESQQNGLPGEFNELSEQQREDLKTHQLTLNYSAKKMHVEDDRQFIQFGVLPIMASNGYTQLGLAASALIQQGDSKSLIELAHLPSTSEKGAHDYLDRLETNLQKASLPLIGSTQQVQGTVSKLTEQAQHNGLPGEWNPLSKDEGQQLQTGDYKLAHSYMEIHMMGREAPDLAR